MNNVETCPLCNAPMEEHVVHEGERLYLVFYCDSCFSEWLPCGYDEWLSFEPPSTRPVAGQPATLPEA